MKRFGSLIVCLGFAVTLSAMAAEQPDGEYSHLRPKGEMEAAPVALGQGVLIEKTAMVEVVFTEALAVSITAQ